MDMKIKRIKYYFIESIKNLARNRVMVVASIGTVAASLFILGIFLILALNVNNAAESIGKTLEIKVYLKDEVTTLKRMELERDIKNIKGVTEVVYISKEQALEDLKKKLGENKAIAEGFEMDNPLPQSFVIKVEKPELISKASYEISKLDGIEKIYDGKGIVEKLIKFTNIVRVASYFLMGILAIISAFLISNTIKLAVYARRREISIMKYLGATDWFIKWPFVIEGILLGLLGSVLSILVLFFSYQYLTNNVSLNLLLFNFVSAQSLLSFILQKFILMGALIGGFGSYLAVKRYLVL
ncbi:permease-like cell division protein FtsX [Caloramator sp. CAR-1]|uniref:permease-like cell division protein FtsX n=1 Tax=Caloramator sp. CAR-1 TaxID=3062777 RepID=UPI0026E1805B|nr:permease-like cell division protein FtsX [Caloramator sp. CAR-1]MDO6353700.1 permease-like cell division protein FtsX [Caloramator sp. CAR-1]